METHNKTIACQNCKSDFIIEPDDFSFYKKMKVPPPTWCPPCRKQRRLMWRNEFSFYNRTCDLCHRAIISQYAPETELTIYCNTCWWGDNWDPKDYTINFDFSRPFFEQYHELRKKVPTLALVNDNGIGSINCDYTQNFALGKNCYMVMVAWKWEDCLYCCYGTDAKYCVDSFGLFGNNENLYESMFVKQSYNCRFIYESSGMIDSAFAYDCRDCTDCFMCAGLRHQKFCIKNVKYSEDEYKNILASYHLDSWAGQKQAKKEFAEFKLTMPHQCSSFKNCVGCTGNYLFNSKNSTYSFNATALEDCKYFDVGDTMKDCHDISVGGEAELCYECVTPDNSSNSISTIYTWKSTEVAYCDFCQASNHCFASVGLKKGEYCILNKQYSKEEYSVLKAKLIAHMKETGEWGEFFPSHNSPFGYNETVAAIDFPLSRDEAIAQGFAWQDHMQITKGKETLLPENIPDSISDIDNSILNEVLRCVECARNYKLTESELTFYKKHHIPVPRSCFFCRVNHRFALKTPSKIWHRTCMCIDGSHSHAQRCPNEFETSYDPARPEVIYCESCYHQSFN